MLECPQVMHNSKEKLRSLETDHAKMYRFKSSICMTATLFRYIGLSSITCNRTRALPNSTLSLHSPCTHDVICITTFLAFLMNSKCVTSFVNHIGCKTYYPRGYNLTERVLTKTKNEPSTHLGTSARIWGGAAAPVPAGYVHN